MNCSERESQLKEFNQDKVDVESKFKNFVEKNYEQFSEDYDKMI